MRSKYKHLVKKIDLKENELALTTEVNNHKAKYYINKRQGFKGNCRICGKYGFKLAYCFENKSNKIKNVKRKFTGKCNYFGIKGHKEDDCWKKERENNTTDAANVAKDNEDSVLMTSAECNEECMCKNKCQFNKKVKKV